MAAKKRSAASYKAAAKKGQATRRKNLKSTSRTTPAKKTTTTKRRKPRAKKSMLSELWNPKMAQAGGKALLSGAVGGAGAGFIEKIMGEVEPNKKLVVVGIASFVVATVFKMPNVGAGMAGVALYKGMANTGMLGEDMDLQEHAYADPIEQLPMVLNEDGYEMDLQEDADGMYLQEDYNVGYFESGFAQ